MILILALGLLLSFFFLAVICEEFFVESLDIMAKKLKLPSDVAGATFMAVGSSAPELFTSMFALFKPGNHADVGAGTIVGSAIFNILVIIGASASFKRAKLTWQPVVRDTLFYVISILILLYSFWDGQITLIESLFFLSVYVGYIFAVVNWKKWLPYSDVNPIDIVEEATEKNAFSRWTKKLLGLIIPDSKKKPHLYLVTFIMSIAGIAGFSFLMVESAVGLADILHISPAIVALTVLAAGTSVPDLLASIVVAKQGRGDMAVSNAVGSNIFDILFGLGFPWFLVLIWHGGTIKVGTENLISSIFLLFATVIAVFFILVARKWTIGKRAGILLLALYVLYLIYGINSAING